MESQPKNVDKSTKNGNGRTRTFAFIMYPDSMADNFIDKLTEFHVPTLISPLHDKDVNPDGTPKKLHYHVLITYDSVRTLSQAHDVGWFCKKNLSIFTSRFPASSNLYFRNTMNIPQLLPEMDSPKFRD